MPKRLLRKRPCNRTISLAGLDVAVRYSERRRTLTIKVDEGRVIVQAPDYAALGDIERFVSHKQAWIQEKVAQQQAQMRARARQWIDGETLPMLGLPVQLQLQDAVKGEVQLEGDNLVVKARQAAPDVTARRVQKLVEQWYKHTADSVIRERVAHWQRHTGITPKGIVTKTYKARWGSCNHRQELSFNWKLLMAPPAVIDYVVVHELCHIVHFNHSPAFWQLVAKYQPDYQVHKRWLRNHGLSLEL
jgi:predicted metal-dependent hydrolase